MGFIIMIIVGGLIGWIAGMIKRYPWWYLR